MLSPDGQIVEAVFHEADLSQTAAADAMRERLEFEGAWGDWLAAQLAEGMNQPLPRGWVPQPDPGSGGLHFLHTRTGVFVCVRVCHRGTCVIEYADQFKRGRMVMLVGPSFH